MSAVTIRPETEPDHRSVDILHEAAFGRPDESRLVQRLRSAVRPRLSLVATEADRVVGHVFFSPVRIEGVKEAPSCAGLAPVSVAPEAQGRGIGGALIRAGLAACPALGWEAVFLLGDPLYYARFGFELSAPIGLQYESEAFDSAFQVLETIRGSLDGCRGWVRFHEAFDEL